MKPLLLNSSYLLKEESRILSKRFGRDYSPIYSEGDVKRTLDLIRVCPDYDHLYDLAYRIANADQKQYLVIHHHRVPLKANCIALSRFSSHAPTADLVKFASSMNTNQIVLVHGEAEAKKELKSLIEQACSKEDKTTKILTSFKGMRIEL